jgi:hypothetical protein
LEFEPIELRSLAVEEKGKLDIDFDIDSGAPFNISRYEIRK